MDNDPTAIEVVDSNVLLNGGDVPDLDITNPPAVSLVGDVVGIRLSTQMKCKLLKLITKLLLVSPHDFIQSKDAVLELEMLPDTPLNLSVIRPLHGTRAQVAQEQVDEWLANGWCEIITDRKNIMPLVVVPKPNNGWRVCVDTTALNPWIKPIPIVLPNIDEVVDFCALCKYLSQIDLSSAFMQMLLHENSYQWVRIEVNGVVYQLHRAVFGIKTVPAVFQSVMTNMLAHIPHVKVYIDNIVVATKSLKKHVEVLLEVLNTLLKNKVRINVSKLELFKSKMKLLGFVVSGDGIEVDVDKVKAILSVPRPLNRKDLMSFVGSVVFQRHFILHCSTLLKPLNSLVSRTLKGKRLVWSDEDIAAFESVKVAIAQPIALFFPRIHEMRIVYTDASAVAIAAVVGVVRDGLFYCWRTWSRTLYDYERAWSSNKREFAALYFGIMAFYDDLVGRTFEVRVDHQALVYGLDTSAQNAMFTRWKQYLQTLDFKIVFIPGESNVLADFLSRQIAVSAVDEARGDVLAGAMIGASSPALPEVHAPVVPVPNADRLLAAESIDDDMFATEPEHMLNVDDMVTFEELWYSITADIRATLPDCLKPSPDAGGVSNALRDASHQHLDPDFLEMYAEYLEEYNAANPSEVDAILDDAVALPSDVALVDNTVATHNARITHNVESNVVPLPVLNLSNAVARRPAAHTAGIATDAAIKVKLNTALMMPAARKYYRWLPATQVGEPALREDFNLAPGASPAENEHPSEEAKLVMLTAVHAETGHGGRMKMLKYLDAFKRKWKNAAADVAEWLTTCDLCMRYKRGVQHYLPVRSAVSDEPFSAIQLDLMAMENDRGYTAALVIVDIYSGYIYAEPITSKHSDVVVEAFVKFVSRFGPPRSVQSDQGREFVNQLMSQFVKIMHIKYGLSTPHYPQSNGKVERSIGTIKGVLKTMCGGKRSDWVDALPWAVLAINRTVHSSTGHTPFSVVFARHGYSFLLGEPPLDPDNNVDWLQHLALVRNSFSDNLQALRAARSKYSAEKYDASHPVDPVNVGDYVFYLNHEYSAINSSVTIWFGPCIVTKVDDRGNVELKTPRGVKLQRPFPRALLKKRSSTAPLSPMVVDCIVTHKPDANGSMMYLIRFEGYDSTADEWITESVARRLKVYDDYCLINSVRSE